MSLEQAATLVEVPTKRTVWRIVLTAVSATILLAALVVGGYAVYHDKTTEVSHLKTQLEQLRATNATLGGQLATTRTTLRRRNVKLTAATTGLTQAKRNLTRQRNQLAAANERADASYNSGYSSGSSAGYSSGSSAGYSSGRSAGMVEASDELACSDDLDVTWLPLCT
jgi:septal ring factor EnvC (AmiA/AmiB activator)